MVPMRKSCLLPTLEQTRMLLSSDFFHVFSVLILIRHLDLSFMHNHSHTHIHIHLSSSCGALPEPPTENVPLTQPFPPQLHQRDVALEWTTVATHRRTSLYMGFTWAEDTAAQRLCEHLRFQKSTPRALRAARKSCIRLRMMKSHLT